MILVTGAGGIIGSHLCDYLYKNSIEFLPIYKTDFEKKFKNAVQLDLSSNIRFLDKYASKIKSIIHLAAGVPHSTHYPDEKSTYLKNIKMDINISELQKFTNANLIYASTCGLYNKLSDEYKSENEKLFAKSYYFKSKLEGENLFKNSKTSIIRISAPIGHKIKKGLVLERFYNNSIKEKDLTIWGSGLREQDFIDCDDIVNLILKILNKPIYDIFNVASGNPISMVNLANLIITFNNKGKIKYLNKIDPNDNAKARYSIQKAKAIYGWSPKNDLLDMFKKYLLNKKLK